MTNRRKKLTYIQLIIFTIAAVVYFWMKHLPILSNNVNMAAKHELFYVTRVVDGDTLKLSNGEKVRLIGIDTPELHYSNKLIRDARRSHRDIKTIQELGRRAAAFTEGLCYNKNVWLEFDVEKKDKYGRWLGYVYLEDGTFINAKILEEGYGQVMTIPPNVKYADYFVKLVKEARSNNKGLWAATDNL